MNDFDKKLDFDSNTFENMKHDMNFVLQRLLGNMIEKQSNEGSMTIKIDVTMVKEFIPNYDPNIKGESREISKPQFKHKVTSAVKITDEKGEISTTRWRWLWMKKLAAMYYSRLQTHSRERFLTQTLCRVRSRKEKATRILSTVHTSMQT